MIDFLKLRFDELGYFAFGGSTLVCLFQKDQIVYDSDLRENSQKQLETLVQVGDTIGKREEQWKNFDVWYDRKHDSNLSEKKFF